MRFGTLISPTPISRKAASKRLKRSSTKSCAKSSAGGGNCFSRSSTSTACSVKTSKRPSTVSGTPAAYFELDGPPGADTEVAFFGVLPQFAGLGLGGALLTDAVRRAWARNPPRVWLHTCSFDHPGALRNYLARGFRLVRGETHPKEMPASPPGPWSGAGRTLEMIARLRTRSEGDAP